jgi:uncharacterized membrane protein YedE/YeeE
LIIGGKTFGVSSNLRTICTACGADKINSFFDFNWKDQIWNLIFIFGALFGGYLAANYLTLDQSVEISVNTIDKLSSLGINSHSESYLPTEIFDLLNSNNTLFSILLLSIGGFLVGFGTRYAGGCTSGHAITGLSQLQIGSLIAVIGFFIGGLTIIHFVYPLIF